MTRGKNMQPGTHDAAFLTSVIKPSKIQKLKMILFQAKNHAQQIMSLTLMKIKPILNEHQMRKVT